MKKRILKWSSLNLVLLSFAASPVVVQAQFFNNGSSPANGDLLAGFRKTGAHQGTNELVVNIGNITNLLTLPLGSTLTMANVPPARLTDAFSSDYTFLQWSVFSANYSVDSDWITPLGNFPLTTLWYTLPRTNISIQTTPPVRLSKNAQGPISGSMAEIGNGASSISEALPGGTNTDNNTVLAREPVQAVYQQFLLTVGMGDSMNTTKGDFGGSEISYSVEQITPSPFSSSVRSDLYESAPAPGRKSPTSPLTFYVDPISGNTTNVYYVGYFDLSPAGVLTFTRAAAVAPLPPAPLLKVARSGITNNISFATANGATYTLIFTNLAGLSSPRSNWFTLGSPITGTGGTTNFMDASTDSNRVYSVKAH
jgi:hypothetical protein